MRIDEKIELYLTEAALQITQYYEFNSEKEAYKLLDWLTKNGFDDYSDKDVQKKKKTWVINLLPQYKQHGSEIQDAAVKIKRGLNEASAPSKDEIAYVVGNAAGEPNKFIVYGSKEHAEKSMTKYALKPKKSLAQALFAANDEQGYTHYTVKRGYDAWEPVKRIPAKYLDADKYMD